MVLVPTAPNFFGTVSYFGIRWSYARWWRHGRLAVGIIPGVAASILEGLDAMLTVNRLGLPAESRRSLVCTNSTSADAFVADVLKARRNHWEFLKKDLVVRQFFAVTLRMFEEQRDEDFHESTGGFDQLLSVLGSIQELQVLGNSRNKATRLKPLVRFRRCDGRGP